MLILGRRKGEIIDIGEDIFVQVVDIQKNLVKIGITAPNDVIVNRREITLKMELLRNEARDEIRKLIRHLREEARDDDVAV